jgi:hypothetical protein
MADTLRNCSRARSISDSERRVRGGMLNGFSADQNRVDHWVL